MHQWIMFLSLRPCAFDHAMYRTCDSCARDFGLQGICNFMFKLGCTANVLAWVLLMILEITMIEVHRIFIQQFFGKNVNKSG